MVAKCHLQYSQVAWLWISVAASFLHQGKATAFMSCLWTAGDMFNWSLCEQESFGLSQQYPFDVLTSSLTTQSWKNFVIYHWLWVVPSWHTKYQCLLSMYYFNISTSWYQTLLCGKYRYRILGEHSSIDRIAALQMRFLRRIWGYQSLVIHVTCFFNVGRIFGGCSSFTQPTEIFTEDPEIVFISHDQVWDYAVSSSITIKNSIPFLKFSARKVRGLGKGALARCMKQDAECKKKVLDISMRNWRCLSRIVWNHAVLKCHNMPF